MTGFSFGRFATLVALLALAVLSPATTSAAANGRQQASLNEGWRFQKGDSVDAPVTTFDPKDWLKVTLPHTFNSADGADGGGYYRGPGWYRRELFITDGAALVADVYVNGQKVGRHEGGYATFRFDVTAQVRPGRNVVAVRVDNSANPHVAPLGGDFTVFGGLYRGVSLIRTPQVHVDALDHGGPGVYATTVSLEAGKAVVRVTTRVSNDGAAGKARVTTRILDAEGKAVAEASSVSPLGAGATSPVAQTLTIDKPRAWNGRKDPYLYTVATEVSAGGEADVVRVPLGLRTTRIDPDKGFFLNGEHLPIHGVNLHLDRPGVGLAVSNDNIAEDFQIMEAMGVNGLRLVHFQHAPKAYELADKAGLVLWTEIPFNAKVGYEPEFLANLKQQLQELIRQNYNHPSVIVWGLGNEVYAADEATNQALAALQTLAKAEDPSRPTVYAHCCASDTDRLTTHTDVIGYNRYYGWYPSKDETMATWADEVHRKAPGRAMMISEYGAGASILHQQDPALRPETTAGFHPEHYQALYHETNWRALRDRPFIWASFVWVGFDFASDGRNEGDRPGINDKGLVSHDRRTPKDAYYWYQANWATAPMVYVTHRRQVLRTTPRADIKVYSNRARATLTVNGVALGAVAVNDHVAVWPNVALTPGVNRIVVQAGEGTEARSDTVEWIYDPSVLDVSEPPKPIKN
jgi:beta-galactosidase